MYIICLLCTYVYIHHLPFNPHFFGQWLKPPHHPHDTDAPVPRSVHCRACAMRRRHGSSARLGAVPVGVENVKFHV